MQNLSTSSHNHYILHYVSSLANSHRIVTTQYKKCGNVVMQPSPMASQAVKWLFPLPLITCNTVMPILDDLLISLKRCIGCIVACLFLRRSHFPQLSSYLSFKVSTSHFSLLDCSQHVQCVVH